MKYFSMFSGIGGFELGIKRATNNTFKCVGFSEIDKYAIETYETHFKHKNYGDAREIEPEQLPDFDFLCGGFPCQAFSIAGKRRGFEDTRGTLFFEIARILKIKRPKIILLENVKGLLNHDQGQTFSVIIQTMAELGYRVEWMVLNSKDYGVPQNRERVFIIGHLGERSSRQVFPIRPSSKSFDKWFSTLQCPGHSCGNYKGMNMLRELTQNKSDAQRIYDSSGIAKTLKGLGGGQGAKTGLYAIPVLTPDRLNKRQNRRRFKENGDPAFTLTSQDKHGVYDGCRIRRLTPIECERLQGFPDNWTIGSDTQRYKQLGNAVTVNVIEHIIKKIFRFDK